MVHYNRGDFFFQPFSLGLTIVVIALIILGVVALSRSLGQQGNRNRRLDEIEKKLEEIDEKLNNINKHNH